jgi:hypothetical protein
VADDYFRPAYYHDNRQDRLGKIRIRRKPGLSGTHAKRIEQRFPVTKRTAGKRTTDVDERILNFCTRWCAQLRTPAALLGVAVLPACHFSY